MTISNLQQNCPGASDRIQKSVSGSLWDLIIRKILTEPNMVLPHSPTQTKLTLLHTNVSPGPNTIGLLVRRMGESVLD